MKTALEVFVIRHSTFVIFSPTVMPFLLLGEETQIEKCCE